MNTDIVAAIQHFYGPIINGYYDDKGERQTEKLKADVEKYLQSIYEEPVQQEQRTIEELFREAMESRLTEIEMETLRPIFKAGAEWAFNFLRNQQND